MIVAIRMPVYHQRAILSSSCIVFLLFYMLTIVMMTIYVINEMHIYNIDTITYEYKYIYILLIEI